MEIEPPTGVCKRRAIGNKINGGRERAGRWRRYECSGFTHIQGQNPAPGSPLESVSTFNPLIIPQHSPDATPKR